MGQQPNIELDISDLPRPSAHPAPARRWVPGRPGELMAPADVPSGGAFGSTGPDPGYALRLVRDRALALDAAETRRNAEAAVAAVAGARAARLGRAPTPEDVEAGALLLGYEPAGFPEALLAELASARARLTANLSHSPRKRVALVAEIADEVLTAETGELRRRMAAGERLLGG